MSERALAGAMLAFVNGALLGGYVYSKSSLGLENIKIKELKDYMIDEVRTKRFLNYPILRS